MYPGETELTRMLRGAHSTARDWKRGGVSRDCGGTECTRTDLDHVDATSLGGVVASLLLGEVDDVTGHRGGDLRKTRG